LGYRLACALCNRMLPERPDEAHAIHLPGLVAYQSGNLGAAIEQLRRAVELAPAVPLFRTNLGEICRLAGRADEAVAYARRALGLNPKNPGALNNHGIALCERREYQEALGCCERAIVLAPAPTAIVATFCTPCGACTTPRPPIVVRSSLTPRLVQAWNNLGTTLRDLERPQETVAAYSRALAEAPNDPAALDHLALVLKDPERRRGALIRYPTADSDFDGPDLCLYSHWANSVL
jgi:protein O-GlcNAc transferase